MTNATVVNQTSNYTTYYYCQYGISINDSFTKVNFTNVVPISVSVNSTHTCQYCNLTAFLYNCSPSRPFKITVVKVAWLKYSNLPAALLALLGLAGVAYGVRQYYGKTQT
jgi:hypothetical protein